MRAKCLSSIILFTRKRMVIQVIRNSNGIRYKVFQRAFLQYGLANLASFIFGTVSQNLQFINSLLHWDHAFGGRGINVVWWNYFRQALFISIPVELFYASVQCEIIWNTLYLYTEKCHMLLLLRIISIKNGLAQHIKSISIP